MIYSVRGRGDLEDKFQIDTLTGRITQISPLTESDVGKEINLIVQASDNGNILSHKFPKYLTILIKGCNYDFPCVL